MRWKLRRWGDLPLRVKGLVVVALPVAGLLTATIFAYAVQQRTTEEQAAVARIARVRNQISTVLTLLLDAETGVRGFVLSGDESFLAPYSAAFDRLPGALASLEELVGDNPSQLARARRVRFLAGQKLEVLAQIRAESSSTQRPEVLEESNRLMQMTRSELALMGDVEERRLRGRLDAIEASQRIQRGVFIGAIGFGLAGGIVAMVLFTTGIAHRVETISQNAGRLAEGQPLPDAPRGDDELGRLAHALGEASALLADREGRLREAKEGAEAANWAKSEFLSRTSHELRTPLTAIRGFSGFLSTQQLTPKHLQAVDHIIKASDHLTGVISDILDIARIEAGKLPISIEPVPVKRTVAEAISLLSGTADEHGCVILNRVRDGGLVLADERRLRQVLMNLVSNAIKYNRPGGLVTVSCTREDRIVSISVRDEGEGIEPDDVERLFAPYERLGAEQTHIKGVGLGLTISKSLIELMDGDLTAESVVGQGSTFTVMLPMAGPIDTGTDDELQAVES